MKKERYSNIIFKSSHLQLFNIILFFSICSCASPIGDHHPEWKKYFDQYHVSGCIEIFDLKESKFIDYNPDRCVQRFIPASTFKICNSLIALESKIISDTSYVFKWDSVQRNVESWNHDQSMKEAFRNSCVPCFQQIAREVGTERYQYYLQLLHYGNMNPGGSVDSFWLNGDLRISCDEQIEFLKNLYTEQLPISKRIQQLVKGMMLIEKNAAYSLYGKTGWATVRGESELASDTSMKNIGWFVGWVQKGESAYFFALNIESSEPAPENFGDARKKIVEECLREQKILL